MIFTGLTVSEVQSAQPLLWEKGTEERGAQHCSQEQCRKGQSRRKGVRTRTGPGNGARDPLCHPTAQHFHDPGTG